MSSDISPFDVSLGLEKTHVLVTGGAGQIGAVVVKSFLAAGALVSAFDVDQSRMVFQHENLNWQVADITDEAGLEERFARAVQRFGPISVCVAVAGRDLSFIKHHRSMVDMSLEQWNSTINTNLTGSFLTARTWMRGLTRIPPHVQNVSLVLFSSEAASMGVKSNADYSSSKAGLQGLVSSLAPDVVNLHPRARVNAVAPGAVDTPQFRKECAEDPQARWIDSEATVVQKRAVPIDVIARTCLFLASDRFSGSVTAQTIQINGGKGGKIFYLPDGSAC